MAGRECEKEKKKDEGERVKEKRSEGGRVSAGVKRRVICKAVSWAQKWLILESHALPMPDIPTCCGLQSGMMVSFLGQTGLTPERKSAHTAKRTATCARHLLPRHRPLTTTPEQSFREKKKRCKKWHSCPRCCDMRLVHVPCHVDMGAGAAAPSAAPLTVATLACTRASRQRSPPSNAMLTGITE